MKFYDGWQGYVRIMKRVLLLPLAFLIIYAIVLVVSGSSHAGQRIIGIIGFIVFLTIAVSVLYGIAAILIALSKPKK